MSQTTVEISRNSTISGQVFSTALLLRHTDHKMAFRNTQGI